MPDDLHARYEKQLQQEFRRAFRQITQIYEEAVTAIALKASTVGVKGGLFSLHQNPALEKEVLARIQKMHPRIYRQIVQAVERSWQLANDKNDRIVDKRLAGKTTAAAKRVLYDTNADALQRFLTRKEKGLDLSERVWNLLDPFKKEMEQGLGLGLAKGQSAKSLATEMKKFLHEPDRLFRRVRNEEGKLVLSKAARNYHPGQGIYRSSYKNALRLTRTETNIAYRSADFERWQQLPFITGIEIKLSNRHPKFDICDHMVGDYPKDFKFTGWHPQCLCYQVPKQMSDAEYSKWEDQLLETGKIPEAAAKQVSSPPPGFGKWMQQNSERVKGWSSKPYWVRDNGKFVRSFFN